MARSEPRAAASLSQLAGLIDWAAIDRDLVGLSASRKGEPGWPPGGAVDRPAGVAFGSCSDAGDLA